MSHNRKSRTAPHSSNTNTIYNSPKRTLKPHQPQPIHHSPIMFIFMLYQMHDLVDATSVLAETFDDIFDIKFSPTMFSIMAATTPSSRCIIALQLSPQFFNAYLCHQLHYKFIYIEDFYDFMHNFERKGFSSLTFTFPEPDRVDSNVALRGL